MSQATPSTAAGPESLRVAVIGYGLAGSVFHAPLIASTPGMRMAAIVTSDPGRQTQARRDFPDASVHPGVGALLADPSALDLVVVAAPNRAHVSLGLAVLETGLPVVVDKPIAPSSSEAERLLDAAQRSGKLLTVFQNRRWDGDFLTARRLIERDVLGRVVRFESRFERFRPTPKPGAWRERPDAEEGGGLLLDLGAHLVDQARVLFGDPVSVYAESESRRPGALVDDDTFIALRFAGGQVAHLWASAVPRESGPRMRVVGMHGVYEKRELDPQEDALAHGMRPGDERWGRESRDRWGRLVTEVGGLHTEGAVETIPGSYESFYSLVRDALVSGSPPPVDPADSIAVLRLLEAARESARSGHVVRVTGG